MNDSYMNLLEKKKYESRYYDSCDMIEHVIEENPRNLLVCIQYEVMQRRSVYHAYLSFCSTLGDDAMSYNDFDFWYYRFRNGEYDLDYDRSKDPKLRELSDLPIELVEMIIENIEEEERYDLANVSKAFRGIIDKQSVRELKIEINMEEFKISYNQRKLCFNCEDETVYNKMKEDTSGDMVEEPARKTYTEMGFNELARIFNHPERLFGQIALNFKPETSHLENCVFYEYLHGPEKAARRKEKRAAKLKEIHNRLETFFKSLSHQIHAEKCNVTNATSEEQVLSVLSCMKPGHLQEIQISGKNQFNIDRIIESDQFKQANSFILSGINFEHSVDTLFHFNKIDAYMNTFLTVDELTRLKDAFLTSPDFESCTLSYKDDKPSNEIKNAFDEKVFPFPDDSQGFLRIRAIHCFVFIKRVYST